MNNIDLYNQQKYAVMTALDNLAKAGKECGYTKEMIVDDINDIVVKVERDLR